MIWCVNWSFRKNLKATGLQQESDKEVSGLGNLLGDRNGYTGICLQNNFKSRESSLQHARGLPSAEPGSEPLSYLKNPEKENPVRPWSARGGGLGSGRLHTGHAQGVDRQVGFGSRDESGSACGRPSKRKLVLFRFPRTGARRRKPPAGPTRHSAAPQQCPATASLTVSSPEEGRRRSWVRRRPQPFPPLAPSASLAAI